MGGSAPATGRSGDPGGGGLRVDDRPLCHCRWQHAGGRREQPLPSRPRSVGRRHPRRRRLPAGAAVAPGRRVSWASRRREVALLLVVLALGAGLRAAFLRHEAVVFPDEGSYLELAANMRDGRGFVSDWKWHYWDAAITHPEDNRQPALPVTLAGLELLLPRGHDRAIGQGLVFGLGLVLIVAAWAYGRALFGVAGGLFAALLVAVEPRLSQFSASAMTGVAMAVVAVGLGLLL